MIEAGDGRLWRRLLELQPDGLQRLSRRFHATRIGGMPREIFAQDAADARRTLWGVPLEMPPMLIEACDWRGLEAQIVRCGEMLERTARDLFGARRLVTAGLVDGERLGRHAAFQRLHEFRPAAEQWVRWFALTVARQPDGQWLVLRLHTERPAGLTGMASNREQLNGVLPGISAAMGIASLQSAIDAYAHSLRTAANPLAHSGTARGALLSAGPHNPDYLGDQYLAKQLDLELVESRDLILKGDRLYQRQIDGDERVHLLVVRLDHEMCDPAFFREESLLGVPGLMRACAAGNVLLVNTPGAHLLAPALEDIDLERCATHLGCEPPAFTWRVAERDLGRQLTAPASTTPVWNADRLIAQPVALIVHAFLGADQRWHCIPGALGRTAPAPHASFSLHEGGGVLDVWVEASSLDLVRATSVGAADRGRARALHENAYWLGRYSTRCEYQLRAIGIARGYVGTDEAETQLSWEAFDDLLRAHLHVVAQRAPSLTGSPQLFLQALPNLALLVPFHEGVVSNAARLTLCGFALRGYLDERYNAHIDTLRDTMRGAVGGFADSLVKRRLQAATAVAEALLERHESTEVFESEAGGLTISYLVGRHLEQQLLWSQVMHAFLRHDCLPHPSACGLLARLLGGAAASTQQLVPDDFPQFLRQHVTTDGPSWTLLNTSARLADALDEVRGTPREFGQRVRGQAASVERWVAASGDTDEVLVSARWLRHCATLIEEHSRLSDDLTQWCFVDARRGRP